MCKNLHYVDIWKKQSELFWRTVYAAPVIGVAVLAGSYGLKNAGDYTLSILLLIAGIIAMSIQMAILVRMSQYLIAFRKAADKLIPAVPSARFGLTGYCLGVATSVFLILLFVVMLFLALLDKPNGDRTNTTVNESKSSIVTFPDNKLDSDVARSAEPVN